MTACFHGVFQLKTSLTFSLANGDADWGPEWMWKALEKFITGSKGRVFYFCRAGGGGAVTEAAVEEDSVSVSIPLWH